MDAGLSTKNASNPSETMIHAINVNFCVFL